MADGWHTRYKQDERNYSEKFTPPWHAIVIFRQNLEMRGLEDDHVVLDSVASDLVCDVYCAMNL